jgi:fatty-acyl-CoA synthase
MTVGGLRGGAPEPERPLASKPAWAATDVAQDIISIVEGHALESPDAPAVVDSRGTLTYRELVEQCHRFAAGLKASGMSTGTPVDTDFL